MIGAALRSNYALVHEALANKTLTLEHVLIDDCALNFPHLQASALTSGVQLT
jgi:hypothetical protein